jgi:NitT/TauT family transport system substrate-binding protein
MSLTDRNKSLLNRVGILATAGIVGTTLLACGGKDTATTADSGGDASMCSKIHIGTQDQVINTAVGGAVVRELKVFEDLLPKDGKYKDLDYTVEWSSYTSGPPITNKMMAGQIQIGLMGDFPAVINLIKGREGTGETKTVFIGTLAYSPNGAGNAVVVPIDSDATSLEDLKGGTVSVPFGSAAHGMVLKALKDAGIDTDKDLTLISQAPEVGGSALQKKQIEAHADFVPFGELFPYRGFAKKIFDGAQTGVPTLHGITVREDFAKNCPEVVTAFMQSVLEANKKFTDSPETISAQIEEWSGIDKEVVYMFLGPSGLQYLSPEIEEVQLQALENSIATLMSLGKIENKEIKPSDVRGWIDSSYLEKAAANLNTTIAEQIKKGKEYQISGKDALDGSEITDPKNAGQIWIEGEDNVQNYSSPLTMAKAVKEFEAGGKKPSALFVHDMNKGWKLFAQTAYYVDNNGVITAFLLKADADDYAAKSGGTVIDFTNLQSMT